MVDAKDQQNVIYLAQDLMLMGNDEKFQVVHNGCNKWQEPFDAKLYNAKVVMVLKADDEPCNGCLRVATKRIQQGAEIAAPRGREFWCYQNNFDSLDNMGKVNCMAFYDIKEQDFVLDFGKDGLPFPFEKKKKVFRTK